MACSYFHISRKCNYAVRALMVLAEDTSGQAINVRYISESRKIPLRFLEIILNELKQGGIVRSVRGKAGGYILSREATELTLGEVICFLEKYESVQKDEVTPGELPICNVLSKANMAVGSILEGVTIADLVKDL